MFMPVVAARRLLLGALCCFVGLQAVAQESAYPQRAVRLVTWSSGGGTVDVVTRLIGEHLAKRWKQPVTVDNRTGAAGMIATEYVARSLADGYTLLFTSPTAHIYNPLLRKTSYDPFKDFEPLSLLVTGEMALVAARDAPFNDVRELLKQHQSKGISYGTWGVGSGGHLLGEQMQAQSGVPMLQVPYKAGETAILTDVVGGRLDVGFMGAGTAKNYAAAGKLKILGVTGEHQGKLLPKVPTFAEQGMRGMEFGGWVGAYAPAGTPRPVVDKILAGLRDALAQPAIAAKLNELVYEVVASTPQELTAANRREYRQWGELIRTRNIQPD